MEIDGTKPIIPTMRVHSLIYDAITVQHAKPFANQAPLWTPICYGRGTKE